MNPSISIPYVLLLLVSLSSGFYIAPQPPLFTASRTFPHRAEFGELSISETPHLSPALIQSAQERLPWEGEYSDKEDEDLTWQTGERWYETREGLMNAWVLPDSCLGTWENYALAANRGEEKVLTKAPQLLRLDHVVDSAKMVLSKLKLPPALLRQEPLLMTMKPERLHGGFEIIRGGGDVALVREACKNTPGLLFEAAMTWNE